MLKGFVLGIVLTGLLAAGGAYWYFASGRAPVAASAPPMPFEKTFARMGLHAYLNKLPHPKPQVPADDANLLAGARVYKDNCAVCHTLPGMDRSSIARGMFPPPPPLFQGKGVTDDEEWETYWKVENGIRMSGMPEFKGSLTETQIWQVTVLVKNADKLPPAVRSDLGSAAPPSSTATPTNH
ncbi:MAG TPA: cytochrome c [Thermoanaerobaculia bacterium]|nr:cytochrome c [Thermoanaerobaculia bacterium]